MLAADDPRDVLHKLQDRARLPRDGELPASTGEVLIYRLAAEFLSHATFARDRWELRSGYSDSSGGYGDPVRQHLFDAIPATKPRLATPHADDAFGIAAYRFWFLLKDGEPQAAFERVDGAGTLWRRADGQRFDLAATYAAEHRRLWPLLWRTLGPLLP